MFLKSMNYKTEKTIKVEIQMRSQDNDLGKIFYQRYQKKLVKLLKIKEDIQIINQENDLG